MFQLEKRNLKGLNIGYYRPTFTLFYESNDPKIPRYLDFWRFMSKRFVYIDFVTVDSSKYAEFGSGNIVENWPCVSIREDHINPEIIKGVDTVFLMKKAEVFSYRTFKKEVKFYKSRYPKKETNL